MRTIIVILFFLSFLMTNGQNKWISKTGNDNNTGDKDAPYKTILKGLTNIGYKDTIFVAEGTYEEHADYIVFGLGGRQVILRKKMSTVSITIKGSGLFTMQTGSPMINSSTTVSLTTEQITDPLMSVRYMIVYYNTEITGTATKNNCMFGLGSTVTYTIPANKYSSLISQIDADNKAMNDLNSNKQSYANSNGTCANIPVYYNIKRNSTIIKNDCAPGYKGSLVTYIVPAGKYNSTVSQLDADNKAWIEVLANRQLYANTNGNCSFVGYYNIKRNSTVSKNDCAPGYKGSSVTYVVPAGKYNSTISQLDANNKAWTEVLANRQSYANVNGTCIFTGIYYNIKRNSTLAKNDCAPGYKGSSVTYIVPAGKYSSTISQEDANNKAWAEVLANRQTYANTNGTCIPK